MTLFIKNKISTILDNLRKQNQEDMIKVHNYIKMSWPSILYILDPPLCFQLTISAHYQFCM